MAAPKKPKTFDTELRVYITSDMDADLKEEADREERLISNMVRVLLGEALAARRQEHAGQ